jgi:hypothetical protein
MDVDMPPPKRSDMPPPRLLWKRINAARIRLVMTTRIETVRIGHVSKGATVTRAF